MSKKYPGSEPPMKIGPYDPDEDRMSVSWTGHDHWKDKACADLERQLAEAQEEIQRLRPAKRIRGSSLRWDIPARLRELRDAALVERDEAQGKLEAVRRVGEEYFRMGVGDVAYELRNAILGGKGD